MSENNHNGYHQSKIANLYSTPPGISGMLGNPPPGYAQRLREDMLIAIEQNKRTREKIDSLKRIRLISCFALFFALTALCVAIIDFLQ